MVVQPDSPDPATTSQPIDDALRETCAQIYDRLTRLEASLHRTEGIVADKPWDLAPIAFKRLERVEDMLRSMQRTMDDSTLNEMCVNLERQIVQTRMAVQRTETAVSSQSLREFCADIDARLMRTEDTLRRTEGIVARWREERPAPAAADAAMVRDEPLPWPPGLAMTAAAAAMTIVIGALIWTIIGREPSPSVSREMRASSAPAQTSAAPQVVPVTAPLPQSPAPSPAANVVRLKPNTTSGMPPAREQTASKQAAPIRRATATRAQFVGTLSITSVPSGASVSINGKAAGVTPLRLPRQRAGSLAVQIAQDGFERWSAAVRVPADQLTQVTARLRPIVQ